MSVGALGRSQGHAFSSSVAPLILVFPAGGFKRLLSAENLDVALVKSQAHTKFLSILRGIKTGKAGFIPPVYKTGAGRGEWEGAEFHFSSKSESGASSAPLRPQPQRVLKGDSLVILGNERARRTHFHLKLGECEAGRLCQRKGSRVNLMAHCPCHSWLASLFC